VSYKFPTNPFPRVSPDKFTKFNKKKVTEDFVQINFEKQGWKMYEPFQDIGIDRIATIFDDKKKITRFIQIKTRSLENYKFGYTLKPKDIICDPRITFLFYCDSTQDFFIFQINDFLELCKKTNFARSHFEVPSFKYCNQRVKPITFHPDSENDKWTFNGHTISEFVNLNGLKKIKNSEIDSDDKLFKKKLIEISQFRREHFFAFSYENPDNQNNSFSRTQVETINKHSNKFLKKEKKDLLEIYRLNQKIKEMLPKDIQESMNLYLNNNIFEIEQEDNF